jgi:hypothetical protein
MFATKPIVPDLSGRSAAATAERVVAMKRPGDIAIVSVHWGSNGGTTSNDATLISPTG